jgi:hypothetical protein
MRQTAIFYINGERKECILFQKGDRVRPIASDAVAIGAEGTVIGTSEGGLFVDVKWDKEEYPSTLGGTVRLGTQRLVDRLELIETEVESQ